MKLRTQKRERQSERGVALVIAIFTLMLISVVATALILMAGTQTAMKGNYKSAMHAFYDAKAGLEEARGRLWGFNSNPISDCVFQSGPPMKIGEVCYITNPSGDEIVDPTKPANQYADVEYQTEFKGLSLGGAHLVPSTSPTGVIKGSLYKWVRITPRTEASANIDVDGKNGLDNLTPLFYDGQQQVLSGSGGGGSQVLTITSLAVTPYGSRRMVQYTVAPAAYTAALGTFPSALTVAGNGVSFTGPSGGSGNGNGGPGGGGSSNFQLNGNDRDARAGTPSGVPAIGYTNSNDASSILMAAVPSTNYLSPAAVPNVGLVPLLPLLQT